MAKGIEVQLYNETGELIVNATSLQIAWFDTPDVGDLSRVQATHSGITTDASGWLKLDLSNVTGLALTEWGFLVVYSENLSDHKNSQVFASKMQITEVTGGTDVYAQSSYVRPADWLTMPTLVNGDQKFVGLFAVHESNSNFVALSCSGNYVVNWGDGSGDINVAAGVKAERNIQWADVGSGTLTSEGFRQALVTVTMQAGQTMTSFSLQQKHSQSGLPSVPVVRWLEIDINAPSLSTLGISSGASVVRPRTLKRFFLGENSVASFSYLFATLPVIQSVAIADTSSCNNFSAMFNGCASLRRIPWMDTSTGTNFSNMFSGCSSLQTLPLLDTSLGTTFSGMFANCGSLQTIPLLNTAAGIGFSYMFQACYSLKSIPLLNTALSIDFSYMFWNCASLRSIPLIDTILGIDFGDMLSQCPSLEEVPLLNTVSGIYFDAMFFNCASLKTVPLLNTTSGIDFSNMFNGCTSLQSIPLLNTAAGTSFTTVFSGCQALAKGRLNGTTRAISYSNLMLSASALDDIYTGLGTAFGAQTITVTGNWGVTSDTPSIATAKGWTVTG